MSLKYFNYVLKVEDQLLFSKDNLVERKPDKEEKIIAANEIFVCKDRWQNLDSYQDRKFQLMYEKSAEIVYGEILSESYQRLKKSDGNAGLEEFKKRLAEAGWKVLTDEQTALVNAWHGSSVELEYV